MSLTEFIGFWTLGYWSKLLNFKWYKNNVVKIYDFILNYILMYNYRFRILLEEYSKKIILYTSD